MMGQKFESIRTADGGTVHVSKKLYGTLPHVYRELERQIRIATTFDDKGFLGLGSANDVEYHEDRGVRLFDGRVFVPGFVGEAVDPSVWYEFKTGQFGLRTVDAATDKLLRSRSPFQIFSQGRIINERFDAVGKRIHRGGQREEGERILAAAEAGTLDANERASEITRAKNLIDRSNTIAQVERMYASQNQRRDDGRGYVWFFNGSPDVKPKDYDNAMSRPGRTFNTHMQGIDWLTKNRTGGVWSGQSSQWQSDQLNATLLHLQYPEQFMIKPEEMPDINAFVESLRP